MFILYYQKLLKFFIDVLVSIFFSFTVLGIAYYLQSQGSLQGDNILSISKAFFLISTSLCFIFTVVNCVIETKMVNNYIKKFDLPKKTIIKGIYVYKINPEGMDRKDFIIQYNIARASRKAVKLIRGLKN